MKCLITGINGFAGSYLAENLLTHKTKTYGTIYPKDAVGNINHLLDKIKITACNLTTPQKIEEIIKKIKPDRLFHLAAQGFVPLSWANTIETLKINILGTLYLISAVKKYSPHTRILIVGSADEYGSANGNKPVTETTSLNPQNPYAVTKTCIDYLSDQIGQFHKLHIVRVRPFPHAGPRQSPNFVISDFSRQIALIEKNKQKNVLRVGDLESKRDFTDVRDMVRAYWLALEKGKSGEVYNIAGEKAYSIREILTQLLSLSNVDIKIEYARAKFRIHDTKVKLGSSQKFRRQTGWKPKIPIETTMEDTLNWWRSRV